MRHFILLVTVATLFSCGQDDTKLKELELKERELALKEKEFQLKENGNTKDTTKTNTTPVVETQHATISHPLKTCQL